MRVPIFRGLDARGGRKLRTYTHKWDNYSNPRCAHARPGLINDVIMEVVCVRGTMDSHAYFMRETASSLGIRGGKGPQCPLVSPPMSNSAVLRGETLDANVGQKFLAAAIFPRKCGRCVKIERQNFLGKIVAATEFPGDRKLFDAILQPRGARGEPLNLLGQSSTLLMKMLIIKKHGSD